MTLWKRVSWRVMVEEKRALIAEKLKHSDPTVVISDQKGIFIFSPHVEKVHSTIVVAGAGSSVVPIANWARAQIRTLILSWGKNVPDLRSEIKLFPPLFGVNNSPSDDVVYADLVIVEILEDPARDEIFRVNFLGEKERFPGNAAHVISHTYDVDDFDEDDDGDNELSPVVKGGINDGLERILGTRDISILISPSAETLDTLKSRYESRIYMNREQLRLHNYSWVCEKL